MWQQFLAHPDCRAVSGVRPTAITFPSPRRLHWMIEERVAELEHWARRIRDERERGEVLVEILEAGYRACLMDVAILQDVYSSLLWRVRPAVVRVPGFKLFRRVVEKALTRGAAPARREGMGNERSPREGE
jgi:hypothetical protein